MKNIKISLLALLLVGISSCVKDHNKLDLTAFLDNIPKEKYYVTDILNQDQNFFYGTWKVIGTSGGFSGQGYTPEFEYLVTKPNGIYGLVSDDSLLLYGKMVLVDYPNQSFSLRFVPDPDTSPDQMSKNVPEGSIFIRSDTLDIIGPCCDFFNTQFKRVE